MGIPLGIPMGIHMGIPLVKRSEHFIYICYMLMVCPFSSGTKLENNGLEHGNKTV